MHRRLLALLVLLAVLFGSTVAPVLAHAGGDGFAHATEVVDVHENEALVASSDFQAQSDTKESGSAPSAAVHHHCACAIKVDHLAPDISAFFSVQIFQASLVSAMSSRRSAPLTEPPAA